MTTCLGPAFVNMRAANAKRSKMKPEAGLQVCWTEAVRSLAEINGGISSRECLPGRGFTLFSTAACSTESILQEVFMRIPPNLGNFQISSIS